MLLKRLIIGIFLSTNLFCTFALAGTDIAEEVGKTLTFSELYQSGGIIMIVLSLLSVLGLALIIQSFIVVRTSSLLPSGFIDDAVHMIKRRDTSRADEMTKSQRHIASLLLAATVRAIDKGPEKLHDAVEMAGVRGISQVKQRINYLSNIGAIAPMFGLLGTVFGMIKAFNTIAFESEGAKAIQLAGAISEAMVTTAAGLIVGIPALGFYFYFKGKLNQIVGDTELSADLLVEAALESKGAN